MLRGLLSQRETQTREHCRTPDTVARQTGRIDALGDVAVRAGLMGGSPERSRAATGSIGETPDSVIGACEEMEAKQSKGWRYRDQKDARI